MTTPFTQPSTLDQADLPRIEFLVERVRKQLLRGEWITLAYLELYCNRCHELLPAVEQAAGKRGGGGK